ncbi:MAG TPA: DUF2892 domain-containing protein [Clostridia bacterium]|nr:DUF2892 domain-containing protein [Clostridia bacterium]
MQKNVGTLDSHARLFIGFSLLGIGIIKSSMLVTGLGAMKIATGISRFCPILHVLKLTTVGEDNPLDDLLHKIPEYAEHVVDELGEE